VGFVGIERSIKIGQFIDMPRSLLTVDSDNDYPGGPSSQWRPLLFSLRVKISEFCLREKTIAVFISAALLLDGLCPTM